MHDIKKKYSSFELVIGLTDWAILSIEGVPVRYHSGESMKLYACILLLAHMVYL
jgi:hypothetical protein